MNNTEIIYQTLNLAVQYIAGSQVEGDISEFGVMYGGTAGAIASAIKEHNSGAKLHLFDSFQGLPDPVNTVDAGSVHVLSGVWSKGRCCGGSPESVRASLKPILPDDRVIIHTGWFKDTLKDLNSPLAMLHIDCDLYQSAWDVLDWVFWHALISEGAIILFDDWNCNRASTTAGERMAWEKIVKSHNIIASDEGGYGWSGHKFIVHNYYV